MLRRALLVWGLGHLAIGDRRGWLLLVLQPLAIAAVVFVALQLIDGTRWLAVFPPLLLLLVAWLGQAIHAHRRAIALGAEPGGEIQVAAFLPFALTALTLFWLVGGRHGSPAATVEAYMAAWMDNRPDAAAALFAGSGSGSTVAQMWREQMSELAGTIGEERARFGPTSGLDPARPFDSLRVTEVELTASGEARFTVELVRSERYETVVLGVVPTAAQRTVVVKQVLGISLREDPNQEGIIPSSTWRISAMGVVQR